MKEILSLQNNLIKDLKKLLKKKGRHEQGCYLLEGEHLVEEGLKQSGVMKKVLVTQEFLDKRPAFHQQLTNIETYLVTPEIIKALGHVPTPQGVIGVAMMPELSLDLVLDKPVLLLDNVQDPGNVGTMIRTADAAGFGTVIFGEGSVDIYNDKVLRSMQGSHFHVSVREEPLPETIAQIKNHGMPVYGTELNPEAVVYTDLPQAKRFALVMGNEGQGVSSKVLAMTTQNTYIPIVGQAESLNVAVAAGILMFGLKA